MNEYEFALAFAVPVNVEIDDLVERLGAAGCDDAVVGVGRRGHLSLLFSRSVATASEALTSAIGGVLEACPAAQLIEASPDFVGLTDVASLLGVSRQNVRKLILSCDVAAPVPLHEGRPTIWRLVKILSWLREEKKYRVPDELIELAGATMQVNLAVAAGDADAAAQKELASLIG